MILAFRVMPADGEVEYSDLEETVKNTVNEFVGSEVEFRILQSEPAGFGLQACAFEFQVDETLGSEGLENMLNDLEIVGEANVTKMDRL